MPAHPDVDIQPLISQPVQKDKAGSHPGHQGGRGCACRSPVENENQRIVPDHVDDIHYNGGLHGNPRISHGTKQSGTGIVDRQKRIGQRGQNQVNEGVCHHILLHASKKQGEQLPAEQDASRHNNEGHQASDKHQLVRRLAGPAGLFLSQVLGGHHRSPCGHCRKYIDEQHIDHVNQ